MLLVLITAVQCAVILWLLWYLWSDKAAEGDHWWKRRIGRKERKGAIAAIASTLLSAAALMVSLNIFWYSEVRISEVARGVIDSITLDLYGDDADPRIRLDVSFLNMGNRPYAVNDVYMDLVADESDSLARAQDVLTGVRNAEPRELMIAGGVGLSINAENPGENSVRLGRNDTFRPILIEPGQIVRETYVFNGPLRVLEESFVAGTTVKVYLSLSCIATSGRVFDTEELVGSMVLTDRTLDLVCAKRSPHAIDLLETHNMVTSRMRLATSWVRPSASDTIWLPTSDSTSVRVRMSRGVDGRSAGLVVRRYFDD